MTRSGRNGVLRALDARDAGFDSRGLDLTAPNRRPAARAANDEATPSIAELTGSFLQDAASCELRSPGFGVTGRFRRLLCHRGPAARTAGPYPACPGSSPGGGSECPRREIRAADYESARPGATPGEGTNASQRQGPGRIPRPGLRGTAHLEVRPLLQRGRAGFDSLVPYPPLAQQ